MPRPKKLWTKILNDAGVAVRLYERTSGGPLYREVRTGGGAKDRKSLGHSDRTLAVQEATALARRMGELRFAGHTGTLTLGQLGAL